MLESSSTLSDFCRDHPFSWVPRDVNTAAHSSASWSLTCNLVGSFDLGCCPPALHDALFFSVSINFLRSLSSFFCNLLFPLIFCFSIFNIYIYIYIYITNQGHNQFYSCTVVNEFQLVQQIKYLMIELEI